MSAVAEALHAPQSNIAGTRVATDRQAMALVNLVQKKPLPIFKQTLQKLEKFNNKPAASIPKIVETLHLDPCYSHQIFVEANAGLVKNKRKPAASLSHAILVLGVPRVIDIGEDLPLISDLDNPSTKSRIYQIINRSYHAGVQAREWMSDHGKTSTETAFITAQLSNLYLVSLWFNATDEMTKLYKSSTQQSLFDQNGTLFETRKVLSKQWHHSDLLQQSLDPQADSSQLANTIAFASQVAQIAESGWHSEQMENLIAKSAETLGYTEKEIVQITHRNAVIAARESMFYPVKPAAFRLIEIDKPETPLAKISASPAIKRTKVKTNAKKSVTPAPRKKKTVDKKSAEGLDKQIRILIEMGKKKRSPQEILAFAVKLLSETFDQKPMVFFLLDKNKSLLKSRFIENFDMQKKTITISLNKKSIFLSLIQKQQSVSVSQKNRQKYTKLLPAWLPINIKEKNFVAMSLFIQNKPVGLFYLESETDKPLSSIFYQQFVSICKTTSTALEEVKKHEK